ncbi:MAG: heavy metal-binding domain-containing protein [Akkermansiaceae bacterium]
MKCPECLQKIHDHAEECPHCGMTLERLHPLYHGIDLAVNDGVHDVAGVLRTETRKQLRAAVKVCEKQFVGLSVAVSFVALRDGQTVESYGFWLMNHGEFHRGRIWQSELEDGRGRVILVVDVEGKRVGLSYGYYFDGCIRERENFDVLSAGHASLLEGSIVLGCEQILISLKGLLKKAVTRSRKGAKR